MSDSVRSSGAGPDPGVGEPAALDRQVARRVLKSGMAQMTGRVVITLARLAAAALIVRAFGVERYGEYALILSLLWISDWIVDFGLSDITARELCRRPEDRQGLMAALLASKGLQVLVAYPVLIALLVGLRYPEHVQVAGAVAGIETLFYAGILVCRAAFKADLELQRDVGAELVGALALLPALWVACALEAGLAVLLACFVVSRGLAFGVAWFLGRGQLALRLRGARRETMLAGAREALPLGVSGLFACLYSSLDVMLLSKLATPHDLGLYSGALRLVFPATVLVASLAAVLFPLLAATWEARPSEFERFLQLGLDAIVLVTGFLVVGFIAASHFIVGLLGEDMLAAAPILDVLAVVVFFKALTNTVGAVLVVVGKQGHAVWLTSTGLVVKAVLLAILIPRHGTLGVAYGFLATEIGVGFVLTVWLVQRFTRQRLRWGSTLKVLAVAAVILAGLEGLGWRGGLLAGLGAGMAFLGLALLTRAVRPEHLAGLREGLAARGKA